MGQNEDIPGYEEAKEFITIVHNGDPTPAGDCVTYTAVIDMRGGLLLEKDKVSEFQYYQLCSDFMRMIELEALSRKQGRIVKMVAIIDMWKCGFNTQSDEFVKAQQEFDRSLMQLKPLHLVKHIITINLPWYLLKIANRFTPPDQDGIKSFGDNWAEDAFLAELVPPAKLKQYTMKRVGPEEVETVTKDGSTFIPGGGVLEKIVEVSAGQKVSWTWSLNEGAMLTTSPTLQFRVDALWLPAEGTEGESKDEKSEEKTEGDESEAKDKSDTVIVEPKMYQAKDGEQTGEVTAKKDGFIIIVFSNAHSWMRNKYVHFKINEGS